MITVPMTVAVSNVTVPMTVSASAISIPMSISAEYIMNPYGNYEGEYEYSPSQSVQTIECENKVMTQNVTINPIPEYYGLITWDGSVITVS